MAGRLTWNNVSIPSGDPLKGYEQFAQMFSNALTNTNAAINSLGQTQRENEARAVMGRLLDARNPSQTGTELFRGLSSQAMTDEAYSAALDRRTALEKQQADAFDRDVRQAQEARAVDSHNFNKEGVLLERDIAAQTREREEAQREATRAFGNVVQQGLGLNVPIPDNLIGSLGSDYLARRQAGVTAGNEALDIADLSKSMGSIDGDSAKLVRQRIIADMQIARESGDMNKFIELSNKLASLGKVTSESISNNTPVGSAAPNAANIVPTVEPSNKVPSVITPSNKFSKRSDTLNYLSTYKDSIDNISTNTGVTPGFIGTILDIEAGILGKGSGTGALGPYQFVGTTWNNLLKNNPELAKNIPSIDGTNRGSATDPRLNAEFSNRMMEELIKDNSRQLRNSGLPINEINLWALHNLGGKGVIPYLKNGTINASLKDSLQKNGYSDVGKYFTDYGKRFAEGNSLFDTANIPTNITQTEQSPLDRALSGDVLGAVDQLSTAARSAYERNAIEDKQRRLDSLSFDGVSQILNSVNATNSLSGGGIPITQEQINSSKTSPIKTQHDAVKSLNEAGIGLGLGDGRIFGDLPAALQKINNALGESGNWALTTDVVKNAIQEKWFSGGNFATDTEKVDAIVSWINSGSGAASAFTRAADRADSVTRVQKVGAELQALFDKQLELTRLAERGNQGAAIDLVAVTNSLNSAKSKFLTEVERFESFGRKFTPPEPKTKETDKRENSLWRSFQRTMEIPDLNFTGP